MEEMKQIHESDINQTRKKTAKMQKEKEKIQD